MTKSILLYLLILIIPAVATAQKTDTSIISLLTRPGKYINEINQKIEQYGERLKTNTEKSLARLSRWENRIRRLLQAGSPDAAESLFGKSQVSFAQLLEKLRGGESLGLAYQAQYSRYRDELSTSLTFLMAAAQPDSTLLSSVSLARHQLDTVNSQEDQSAALQEYIKERKKLLTQQAFKFVGNSRYFRKLDKECWYYSATSRNYRELFEHPQKAETGARAILEKIPAFRSFARQHSQLAKLFGSGEQLEKMSDSTTLQTSAGLRNLLRERLTSGNANMLQLVQRYISEGRAQLGALQAQLVAKHTIKDDEPLVADFTPNKQRAKTFLQRLTYSFDLQFGRSNQLLPPGSTVAASIGYKLNDRSVAGAGLSYSLGIGTIRHLRLRHEGVGLRSFIQWKIRQQLYLSGGCELNYNAPFKQVNELKSAAQWQRAALLGLSKEIPVKTKWCSATRVQLLYDFLSGYHYPVSQPLLLRMGYVL